MEKQVVLKKNEEKRILQGHLWVFSNEIASVRGVPAAGDVVVVLRHDDTFLGIGFYNPHSLIAVRFLSKAVEQISYDFFTKRIEQANELRTRLYPSSTTYRMVHGESDFLPGLIVDRYNEYIVLQIVSVGMERCIQMICDVLDSLFHPKAIIARNDISLRTLEQLSQEVKVLRGTPGETIYCEDDVRFVVDVLRGQKTGLFLDQRENRRTLRRYVSDRRVLDCFCNDGGFALHAAAAGATEVVGVDISESTLERAKVNARMNNAKHVTFVHSDVFEYLSKAAENAVTFDVVILDPPSFTKNKKTVATALRGYKKLHIFALKVLKSPGILATASCSHHITEEAFLDVVHQAALKVGRTLQLIEYHGAAPDHPVLLAMPETQYLKFAVFAVQ
ncbi:MAG: class I SAM-dependent rRNA methyltransferase [Bacteroidetes bacterium]|nr:class I SAM-dependent rRNA methyltransferase [Bacteroidota bacterium]